MRTPARHLALPALGLALLGVAWLPPAIPALLRGSIALAALGVLAAGPLRRTTPARRRSVLRGLSMACCLTLTAELGNLVWLASLKSGERSLFEHSSLTHFTTAPGVEAGPYAIDPWGFRAAPRPALTGEPYMVILVGGSTAFGWGLAAEDALGAQLERALREAGVTDPVALVAASPYWTSIQELTYCTQIAPRLRPDAVVVLSGRNDAHYQSSGQLQPLLHMGGGNPLAPPQVLPTLASWSLTLRLLRGLGLRADPAPPQPTARSLPAEPAWLAQRVTSDDVWPQNAACLAAGAEALGQHTLLALQPISHPIDLDADGPTEPAIYARQRAACVRLQPSPHFEPLDLTAALETVPDPRYLDGCHYTAPATAELADRLAAALVARGWTP